MTDELPPNAAPAPAAPEPQTGQPVPQQPSLVDFAVGGDLFKIDARLAAMLAQDPGVPSAQPAYAPQPAQYAPAPQAPAEPPLHELIFRDPQTAINRIRDDIRTELRTEYQRDQVQRSFWNDLYATDPELRRVPRQFVDTVIMESQRQLDGLPTEAGLRRVSQLVRERLASFSNLGQNAAQPNPPSPFPVSTGADAGGSVDRNAPPVGEADPGEPQTLSALIRQRRAQKMQGPRPPQS